MYYVADGKVYADAANGKVAGVNVTAKDKVVTKRELESVTAEVVGKPQEMPYGAVPCTLDMVVAKLNVNEGNPAMFGSPDDSKDSANDSKDSANDSKDSANDSKDSADDSKDSANDSKGASE